MIQTIREKIKEKLDALVTNNDLAVCFDHEPETLNSYPCATMQFKMVSDSIYDTAANLRDIKFLVRVYSKNADKSQSEDDIVVAVWNIIEAIETDTTFGGTVLKTVCENAERLNDVREMEVSYVDISVVSTVRSNR